MRLEGLPRRRFGTPNGIHARAQTKKEWRESDGFERDIEKAAVGMSDASVARSVGDGSLESGRDAARREAWREAFDLLSAADSDRGLAPQDLESLADAAWWNGRADSAMEARERAYASYIKAGENLRAAMVALRLVSDYRSRLATAVGMGFLNRAKRLLREQAPCREQGYLAATIANVARYAGDFDLALEQAREAFEIGIHFADRDLQAMALHEQGQVLVARGDIAEGLAILDESMVAAVGGEVGPYFTGLLFCGMIGTCQAIADYRRAAEWVDAANRAFERRSIAVFPGDCRLHRAEILRLQGAWTEAEHEARRASEELRGYDLRHVGFGFYEIGEVRLRWGDLTAAEEAFAKAHEFGRDPQPGLAMLRLAEGKSQAALTMIKHALENSSWDRLGCARLLPAAVEIGLAAGDGAAAAGWLQELKAIVEGYEAPILNASALCAQGAVQLAEGHAADAVGSLREGWTLWHDLGMPYEGGKARALLALGHMAQGDKETARLELHAAKSTFERLGAAPDARRTSEALEKLADVREARERITRTFMFTDIVRSTNLIEAIGDEAWENLLRWHDRSLRALFEEYGGEEIKQVGDGFFVAFMNSAAAIECAVAINRTMAEHRESQGFAPQIRIGLHASEATRRGGDYVGREVNKAARIGALANGEEILASVETLDPAGRFATSEPRQVRLRGLAAPVEVASVDWR